ncbi:MAG: mandelate racemase/muconate lactonizing enzyme family protein [Propionibacteriales bacterium]|nr:mandelate racemase/muconate lactonizing enzyme family protein [Propionibacteriales bacterium]
MLITAIDAVVARYPLLTGTWKDITGATTHVEYLVVHVHTADGLVGTGFSHTSGPGARTLASLVTDTLAPRLVGEELEHPRTLWQRASRLLRNLGEGGVVSTGLGAVDIAAWDLYAQRSERSLADCLGRFHERVPVYGGGVNLGKDLDELLAEVRTWQDAGYHGVKVKVGGPDPAEDVRRVQAVRAAVGDLPIFLDANQRFEPAEVRRRMEQLETVGPAWIEEPLYCRDVAGHARLRSLSRTPVALGENLYTLRDVEEFLRADAVDYVQVDIPRVGGVTPYLAVAGAAHGRGLQMAPHGVAELSVQVLAALPHAFMAEEVEGASLTALRALADPMPVVDGHLAPYAGPGHGIRFDRDYLDQCRVT